MVANSEFIDYLLKLLQKVGEVKAGPMFGGYRIYQHGIMFSPVSDDALYIKTDKNSIADVKSLSTIISINPVPGDN